MGECNCDEFSHRLSCPASRIKMPEPGREQRPTTEDDVIGSKHDDLDQRVGWQFWRWPAEIRRLRRSQLSLLRRLNAMHLRAGKAEGWITEDGDALIDITRRLGA